MKNRQKIRTQVSWMVEVRAVHYLLAVAAPGSAWTAGGRSHLPRGATIEVKILNLKTPPPPPAHSESESRIS
jgi:hypothetical protein